MEGQSVWHSWPEERRGVDDRRGRLRRGGSARRLKKRERSFSAPVGSEKCACAYGSACACACAYASRCKRMRVCVRRGACTWRARVGRARVGRARAGGAHGAAQSWATGTSSIPTASRRRWGRLPADRAGCGAAPGGTAHGVAQLRKLSA
eukprot:4718896-Pleurochrysis_carterae.AAC.6